MNRSCRGLAFLLSVTFLFSLCLTPAVFATEGDSSPIPGISATPTQDSKTPSPKQQAATADELLNWLRDRNTSGTLTLSADITLGDAKVLRSFGERAVVDAGNHSITITGEVQLLCEGLTITGTGGADGLLRVQPGGQLELQYLTLTAEDGGTALSQAQGAGLLVGGECTVAGDVRYAQTPFIWYWNESPLVLVRPAQTAQLPKTVSAQVNVQGKMERRDVPVLWELDQHLQAQRRRFYAKGSADGYRMAAPPVCTVAYDDFPLTFTKVAAKEQSWCYSVTGGFTKPQVALPITVAEEYSFNGADWTTYYQRTIENQYDGFGIELQKDEGEEHRWDTAAAPYLYIRLRWNDGTNDYFSNQLRFAAADFGTAEDIGGNRGGGTDITDPPTVPLPDPTPTPTPPGNGGGSVPPTPTPTPEPPAAPDAPKPPTSPQSAEVLAAPEPQPKGPGVLPMAVGCAAVAGTIGAAGLYLHPQARKRLLKLLRKLLPKG